MAAHDLRRNAWLAAVLPDKEHFIWVHVVAGRHQTAAADFRLWERILFLLGVSSPVNPGEDTASQNVLTYEAFY